MLLSKATEELIKLASKPNTMQLSWNTINSFKQSPLSDDLNFEQLDTQWILNYTGNTLHESLRWSIEDFNRDINRLSDRNRLFLEFIESQAASILAKQLQERNLFLFSL